ncbi:MAG: hypothetical protein U1E77_12455 [Inhella sp.]
MVFSAAELDLSHDLPPGLVAEAPGSYRIEPARIADWPLVLDRPGHYHLAADLTVPPGEDGLLVTADNVHLDLGGHELAGHCEPEAPCLALEITGRRATLSRGRVHSLSGWAVSLGPDCCMEDVVLVSPSGFGYGFGGASNAQPTPAPVKPALARPRPMTTWQSPACNPNGLPVWVSLRESKARRAAARR